MVFGFIYIVNWKMLFTRVIETLYKSNLRKVKLMYAKMMTSAKIIQVTS